MRIFILLLLLILTFSACKTAVNSNQASANANQVSPNAKRFPFKGKVVSVDKATKKAKVDHEAVVGYMEAMTMEFPVHADMVWDELVPGAEITAELVVDSSSKDGFWLENLV